MSVLTTSQLTFCDLKDSYSIHIDTEYIGVSCYNNGSVIKENTITINYRVFAGQTFVNASCEVSNLPSGVNLVSKTSSSNNKDGNIVIKINSGATLNNEDTSSMKVVFTTDNAEQFTFDKYITFVKSIAGYDGTDAVDFQIYSVDGFEFKHGLSLIELKTAAFQGGKIITSGATYKWKWHNKETGEYEDIPGATLPTFTVQESVKYAFVGLKCEMTYDGIVYEDYVSLSKQTIVYTALTKFINNKNIIGSNDNYVISYVELYKNEEQEDYLRTDKIYKSDNNSISNNIIVTDLNGSYTSGNQVYFICKNTVNNVVRYDVVLGEYNSNRWNVVTNNYNYNNSLFGAMSSNLLYIPREKISRSLNIDFTIDKEGTIVARTHTTVFDLNDPIISNSQPNNPKVGQLWLDTNVSPSILKMWDGTNWVNSSHQKGKTVYTSKPDEGTYSEGDLWILSDNETYNNYTSGTILRAVLKNGKLEWVDALSELTNTIANIHQYFEFNTNTGLKIGQKDEKFYVNVSSTRMSFFDKSNGEEIEERPRDPDEVVYISNKSAVMKKLKVEGDADFEGAASFTQQINIHSTNKSIGFAWNIEDNNSLSLVIN